MKSHHGNKAVMCFCCFKMKIKYYCFQNWEIGKESISKVNFYYLLIFYQFFSLHFVPVCFLILSSLCIIASFSIHVPFLFCDNNIELVEIEINIKSIHRLKNRSNSFDQCLLFKVMILLLATINCPPGDLVVTLSFSLIFIMEVWFCSLVFKLIIL